MAKKVFYPDTAIWRDYFEDRKDNMRPLGEFAFRFLKGCTERKDSILVSNAVEKELLDYYTHERLSQVFLDFIYIISRIEYSKKQSKEAFEFWNKNGRKYSYYDILHLIIARDNKATIITRDRHFEEIGIAEFLPPEQAH